MAATSLGVIRSLNTQVPYCTRAKHVVAATSLSVIRSLNTYCHLKGVGHERMGNSYKDIKQLSPLLFQWGNWLSALSFQQDEFIRFHSRKCI